MNTVYLDWNIISAFKEDDTAIQSLKEIISINPEIIFPFSFAHIYDLAKGSKDIENEFLRNDLSLLEDISLKHYLSYDFLTGRIDPLIAKPQDVFPDFAEEYGKFIIDFSDGNPFNSLLINYFKSVPTNINFSEWEKYPKFKDGFLNFFRRTQQEDNLYNLMLDFGELYSCLINDYSLIRELRSSNIEFLDIDKNEISRSQDPITLINIIMSRSGNEFSFEKLIDTSYLGEKSPFNSFFMRFVMAYLMLDFMGYCQDKFKKKNLFMNFNVDSYHSFFGGHCDYFVSNDLKLISKSKVLFNYFKIQTKAFTLPEFLSDFKTHIQKLSGCEDLVLFIMQAYADFHENMPVHNPELDKIEVTQLDSKPLFDFFNKLYKRIYKDGTTHFMLIRDFVHLGHFFYYTTIQHLTNRMFEELGKDSYNRGMFLCIELDEIKKKEWKGRFWITEKFYIIYSIDFDNFNPYLIIQEK